MDGAGAWQRFTRITLPLVRGPVLIMLVMESMGLVSLVTPILVLTGGGPADATEVVSLRLYFNMGVGATVAMLVPTYIIMAHLGVLDTHVVLILLYTVHSLALAVWIVKAFFETVPVELDQAAMVAIYLSITDVGLDWDALMASATIAVAPIAILFVFFSDNSSAA